MSSMNDEIKLKTIENLASSTAHGLPNIARTDKKLVRLVWIFFTLASFAACSYCVTKSMLEYLDYETVSTISSINENAVEFPTISICVRYGLAGLKILRCYFNLKNCDFNFSYFYDNLYSSSCVRFNFGYDLYGNKTDILYVTSNNILNSFFLEIYLPSQSDKSYGEVIISITNKSSIPFTMTENPYYLMTGNSYFFPIQRTFIEKLEYPYNNCLKDASKFHLNKTIIDYILNSNRTYDQLTCFRLCKNLFAIQYSNCGCTSTIDTFESVCQYKNNNFDDLNSLKVSTCLINYINMFQNTMANKECLKYCPAECDSVSYTIVPFIKPFPVTGNANEEFTKYSEFKTYEDVQKNYISINAYYSELKYTLISEKEKTSLYDLISNIGGILGLFLGVSFLSFIEIIEFLVEIFYILSKYKKNKINKLNSSKK